MKKAEESIKICFTFENAPPVTIKQEGMDIKLLDQRKSIELVAKSEVLLVIDTNIKIMDIIVGEEYKSQKVLFTREFQGIADTPQDSEFVCFFGIDSECKDPSLKFINTDPKKNFDEKVRLMTRRDKRTGVRITKVVVGKDLNFALVLFEDYCLKIIKGTHLYNQEDIRDYEYQIGIRPNELFIHGYNGVTGTFNLIYTTNNGIFMIDKLKADAFDKQRMGDSLYNGVILSAFYSEVLNDLYFLETKDEEVCLSVFNLATKQRSLTIPISGTVHNITRYREYLLIFQSHVSSKNVISKQTTLRNQLIIYDLQNQYVCYKSNKSDIKIYSISASNGDFYLVMQTQNQSESKELLKIRQNSDQEKIDKFLKKPFYDLAYNFADFKGFKELKPKISKLAGDHYYEKKNYELAVKNYIETISNLDQNTLASSEFEPSNIIKKFLEMSQLPYLIEYLEALHKEDKNFANVHHTSLLIYCFLKQKDHIGLQKWLARVAAKSPQSKDQIIELIISACL
jgi:hypothetical protein